MTEKTARAEDEAARTAENAEAGPEQAPAAAATQPAAEPDAAAVAADLKDKLLRTLAEMENLRRRTAREVADAELRGITAFARDMIGVADNMRRALDTVTPEVRNNAEAAMKALIEGVELTERELLKTLEKNGVRKFSPQGEKFDPNVHQAMYEVPAADVPPGHVAHVVQAGYMIGERVLRPALVGVAKAAKPAQPAAVNDNSGSDTVA
jgi:molecular chaperone GrpE